MSINPIEKADSLERIDASDEPLDARLEGTHVCLHPRSPHLTPCRIQGQKDVATTMIYVVQDPRNTINAIPMDDYDLSLPVTTSTCCDLRLLPPARPSTGS